MEKTTQSSPGMILHSVGLKRTPVRLQVLRLLAESHVPLAVPQLIEKLPEHTDAVTVYRTLKTLVAKRLVHRVRGDDRVWRYAGGDPASKTPHQHPHFVCEDCGKVECLAEAVVPGNLARRLGVPDNYTVSYSEVVVHGTCPKCR